MNFTHSITVFCGSNTGNDPIYAKAAQELGAGFVQNHYRLVFGGGNVGLMGILSNTILDMQGEAKGIIPKFLKKKEGEHSRIKDLILTEDMHARKKLLYQEGEAFLILPGGVGTFDEFFEILTWKVLKLHNKPILVININNWADSVYAQLRNTVQQGFASPALLQEFEIVKDVKTTLHRLKALL